MPVFETVLKDGLVLDGTGRPGMHADVAITDGRIAAIGPGLAGRNETDLSGLMVAPGFIDAHTHSDLMLLADPLLPMKVRQGVTLEIVGQDGLSVAPLRPQDRDTVRRQLAALAGNPDLAWDWTTVAGYLQAIDRARPAVDAAYLVPHGQIRRCVLGDEDRTATPAEREAMARLLDQALADGGVGLSTGLIYQPCSYADTAELDALCEVAAAYGRPFVIHLRSESNQLLEALDEVIGIGRRTGVSVHVSHVKIAGPQNWPKLPEMIARIEAARAAGIRVTADQYPYMAGSTLLGTILPPWALSGGSDAAVARLQDPAQRARMRAELHDPTATHWENLWLWTGADGVAIADITSGRHADVVGLTLTEAGRRRGRDPLELAMDLLTEERMAVTMICYSQSEDVVRALMGQSWVCVGTDGILGGRPHPRAYGSYPRLLARYVREQGVLDWPEAVRRMTSQAADIFGLQGYGRLELGYVAHLVAFDPLTVQDRATFAEPRQYPAGLPHVWVHGTPVVRAGEMTGERPGKAVRAFAARP
jgi:N-acyl-D-amino-acid deacylase